MMTTEEKARLTALREEAKKGRDPTAPDETVRLIVEAVKGSESKRYLEIGAGEGYTALSVFADTGAQITAIERDAERAATARRLFTEFGCNARLAEGDAAEILPLLEGPYDVIFLDGPKAQYKKYFPECKRLLRAGGVLFSDDVLLYGWVRGEPPKKRRMLVEHIREYLAMLEADPDFTTKIYEYGEGLAVSHKQQ